MLTHTSSTAALLVLALSSGTASAADAIAGRSAAEAKCGKCHAARDWEGEDAASLESLIRDIVNGQVKHKISLQLSPAEIVDIAEYWGQEEPGK